RTHPALPSFPTRRSSDLARSVRDRDNPKTARDLSGGWWDAGDTDKYVTFTMDPVNQLLTAYQEKPRPFTDDYNIPQSKNGIPDLDRKSTRLNSRHLPNSY